MLKDGPNNVSKRLLHLMFKLFFILCNTSTVSCLPFTSSSLVHIGSQRRRLRETIRSNCGILSAILLLHPSPSYVTSEPGGHILTNFDHDEKDDPVDEYHAEEDTKIHPF